MLVSLVSGLVMRAKPFDRTDAAHLASPRRHTTGRLHRGDRHALPLEFWLPGTGRLFTIHDQLWILASKHTVPPDREYSPKAVPDWLST
jgi:hypothetical protein